MSKQGHDDKQPSARDNADQTNLTGHSRTIVRIINYIETHDRLFNVISAALIATFTIILAVSTIYLWKSTAGLENFAKQQASDMKESIAAARDAAKAASDANVLNRDNFLAMEKLTKQSIDAAKDAVKVAIDANKLNRENFLATQRPWVTADIDIGGPLSFEGGGVNMTLRFQLKNVGHSPATHVVISARIVAHAMGKNNQNNLPLHEELQKFYAETKKRPIGAFGHTLFPGDVFTENLGCGMSAAEFRRITEKSLDFVMLYVVGTVDYGFVFEDGHHQTGFALELKRRFNAARMEESGKKDRNPWFIYPDEGDIAASELYLFRSYWEGRIAD